MPPEKPKLSVEVKKFRGKNGKERGEVMKKVVSIIGVALMVLALAVTSGCGGSGGGSASGGSSTTGVVNGSAK